MATERSLLIDLPEKPRPRNSDHPMGQVDDDDDDDDDDDELMLNVLRCQLTY